VQYVLYVKSVGDGTNYTDSEEAHVNVSFGGSTEPETVTDVLTLTTFGVSGTSYTSETAQRGASGIESDAVYSAQLAGDKGSIQLRSKNSNSGIVTTTSGGNVRKITIVWNDATANERALDIYGSNTAFKDPTELYNTSATKLGSIVKGSSTTLEITGNYPYIGMRSNNGAMYITSIEISYEK